MRELKDEEGKQDTTYIVVGEVKDRFKRHAHTWVRDVLDRPSPLSHIQPTHKHSRAALTPASLLGTALGPEGPRCRRRMGASAEEEG